MELFDEQWMKAFAVKWNSDSKLGDALAKINFDSIICYGFKDEENPRGILVVEKGKVVRSGKYEGEKEYNWDLRASTSRWKKLLSQPMTMPAMAKAYMAGNLKFQKGNYTAMISNPSMASPFIYSFSVMAEVPYEASND